MSLKQQVRVLCCQHKSYKTNLHNSTLYYDYKIYCKVDLQPQFRKLWDQLIAMHKANMSARYFSLQILLEWGE